MKLLTLALISAGLISPNFLMHQDANAAPQSSKASSAAPVKVTAVEGITEYRLNNGMRVILFPDASKPTITTNIIYMVGSRHENYGETGMAHLLEHLLFKPSKKFGLTKGTRSPVEILNSTGSEFNGTTWYDRTNYYATFPAKDENLKLMLEMEADRMLNAAIDQNDLWNPKTQKGEMTVVRNEFEIGESNPLGVTNERIQAAAYDWHNYGKSTIGARSDIENVNIPRLRAFYQKYYQPDNAILMVAGRFDDKKVLAQINQLFGSMAKPKRVLEPTYTKEPTQDGERSITVRRSGGTQYVGAGYHIAPSAHSDATAFSVLGQVLTDAPNGRLYKALIETKLATKVELQEVENLEASYRIFGATVPKESNLDAAQEAMLKTLENLKSNPITAEELARVKQNFKKNVEQISNDTASLTIALTEAQAAGDWRLFFLQRDEIAKMELAQVQAAAEKYLKATNRTLGRFIPTDTIDRTEVPSTPNIAAMVNNYKGNAVVAQGEAFDPTPDNIEARLQKFSLGNGMKVALLPKKTKGEMVSFSLQLNLGDEVSLREKAAIGKLTASMLMRGTTRLSRQELKDKFDQLKALVAVSGDAEKVLVNVSTNKENLLATLDLVTEVLKKPAFNAKDFDELKRAQLNNIEQSIPEPQPLLINEMQRMLDATPANHVRHVLSLPEQLKGVQAVTLESLQAFHKQFYGSNTANFAAVGDFDGASLKADLTKLLGDWKAQQSYQRIPNTMNSLKASSKKLNTPDKASSMMLALHSVPLIDTAEDYPAMLIANHMLGGGALRSRLADRIRQKEGLSYGVGSQYTSSPYEAQGVWFAYAISAPENNAKVEAALRDEMLKAEKEGFTEDELAEAKKGWLQAAENSRTQDAGLAMGLTKYLSLNRTLGYDKKLEAQVKSLSLTQVNAALRKYIQAANLSIISAGDFEKAAKAAPAASK